MRKTLVYTLALFLFMAGCGKTPPASTQAANAPTPSTPSVPPPEPPAGTAAMSPAAPNEATPLETVESREAAAPAAEPATVQVRAGAILRVRIVETLDTKSNRAGDRFDATLVSPVISGQHVIIPAGTRFTGRVTSSYDSGRLKGRGAIAVVLDSFELRGRRHRITTSAYTRVTTDHKKRNAGLIGGGAGVGALIGGLAGGGKGALIGAGAGAGAGTAGAAATGKKHARIPSETVMTFRLRAPVQV